MPNSSSARKSQRQNESRRLRNRAQRSELRTYVKKVRKLADAGDVQAARDMFPTAQKTLDQAAAKNLIHKNKAARLKSRLSKLLKDSESGSSAETPAEA